MTDIPKFEKISYTMVACDRDPSVCSERIANSRGLVKNYFCWHSYSPEPDQSVTDAAFRRCVTKSKSFC